MYMLTITTKTYGRTDSGKSWSSKPVETQTERLPWNVQRGLGDRYGKNVHSKITSADTLSWFRRLGGSEYAERSYTPIGFIVTRLISTDPSRTIRKVRTFSITDEN